MVQKHYNRVNSEYNECSIIHSDCKGSGHQMNVIFKVAIGTGIAAAFLYALLSMGENSTAIQVESESSPSGKNSYETPVNIEENSEAEGLKVRFLEPNSVDFQWASEQGLHEVENFYRARGYYLKFDDSDYHSYSIDTLEKLAEAGDFTALHVLALKYQEEGNRGKALNMHAKAAVYGSTAALANLATFYQTIYFTAGEEDKMLRREAIIGALAHSQVAANRGDRLAKMAADSFIDNIAIELSDQDRHDIDLEAASIYARLLRERSDLGLGEFNDEIPDSVKAYNKRYKMLY